jgi:hypothetical protein
MNTTNNQLTPDRLTSTKRFLISWREENMRALLRTMSGAAVAIACGTALGAQFEWDFNDTLAPSLQSGGVATMNYFNEVTTAATTFGTTGGAIPNPAGGPSGYVYFPGNSIGNGLGGYTISYTGVPANGGGSYVNNYTMIWDLYIPSLGWTALMNTAPDHANDADFYVGSDGSVGIADLGYSSPSLVAAGQWYRVAFVQDQTHNLSLYYLNGTQVFSGAAGSLDGRFSLYTGADTPPQLVILGEGDTSGNYANDVYLSAYYFSDTALTDATITGLGGATAGGIVVPEPTTLSLLALVGLVCWRRRRA